MRYNTYVGPYILIDNPVETYKISIQLFGCPNKECKCYCKEQKGKFCNQCGSELRTVTTNSRKRYNWQELFEEWDEVDVLRDISEGVTFDEFSNIFISNSSKECYDLSESGIVPSEINEDFMNKFKEKAKKLINYADKNNIDYKLGYGTIVYYD